METLITIILILWISNIIGPMLPDGIDTFLKIVFGVIVLIVISAIAYNLWGSAGIVGIVVVLIVGIAVMLYRKIIEEKEREKVNAYLKKKEEIEKRNRLIEAERKKTEPTIKRWEDNRYGRQ